jgi:hypothetical protein
MLVTPDVYRNALQFSSSLNRIIRLDSPITQGVSTQWFARAAFINDDFDSANELSKYERSEYGRLEVAMVGGWLNDLVAYVQDASWAGKRPDLLLRMVRTQLINRFKRLADLALEDLLMAIGTKNLAWFDAAQRQLREAHIGSNDLAVRVIQDLLTAIGEEEGDEAVLKVIDISYNNIWRSRYGLWFDMTALERLALSSEGMRAHYGGPGRRGDFEVTETADTYLMKFDPCGTGQILRRGDFERESEAYIPLESIGRVKKGSDWNNSTTGMPYYCTHCPILLEHLPMRDFGSVLRPVFFELDPSTPCSWSVPKVVSKKK